MIASHALPQPAPGLLDPFRFRASDIGFIPLLIAMPLMYWPKLLDGDTQPWVSIAAAVSLIAFWPRVRSAENDGFLISGVAILALLTYYLRAPSQDGLLRYSVIIGTFVMLWLIGRREGGRLVGKAVRLTIVIWFVLAIYQVIAVRLGLPIDVAGRFDAARSGVPSITAEPSFYGSLSVLQIMYLMTERDSRNIKYMVMAAIGVLLSGSILAMVLLLIPLYRLPFRFKLIGGLLIVSISLVGFDILSSGFFTRLQQLDFAGAGTAIITRDASINLRIGHIYFTLFDNFADQLMLRDGVDFRYEYNSFANKTGLFIANGSDFILASAGELFFRSGPIGLLLIVLLLIRSYRSAGSHYENVEKLVFTIACFVNPITLINPFFVFYIQKKYRSA